jgi:hypothetical protein
MASLHETGISRSRKFIGYLLSILPSFAVLIYGFLKFTDNEAVRATLEQLGVEEHAVLIGGVEILCVILYWIPRTSNIGFFLFCSYAGGILVGEMIMGDVPVPGMVIAVMIYAGTILRKPSLSGLGV